MSARPSVIGASSQGRASHEKFQRKYGLRCGLVGDQDRKVGDAYDVPMGNPLSKNSSRVSFLIDPDGKISHVWSKVSPAAHAEQVLETIKAKQGSA